MSANLAQRLPFTVYDYHQMIAAGILREDERFELIEGDIVKMSPVGEKHGAGVKRLNRLFSRLASHLALVSVQDPIVLDDDTEPMPDVALLILRDDFYVTTKPMAEDVLLVIEVADSSLAYDRSTKARLYAQSGIPELWIWDLNDNSLEVHGHLREGEYRVVRRVRGGETITPERLPEITVSSDDILNRNAA